MHVTDRNNQSSRVIQALLLIVLFVYIVLFEFIIPANKILPKPSILIDTFPVLFSEYDFLSHVLFSFAAIYSVMIISYFFIKAGYRALFYFTENFPGLKGIFIAGKYILPFFIIIFFSLWFGNSIWGEYFFILIILMSALKSHLVIQFENIPDEYISSAKSLGMEKDEILSKVIFKSVQPELFSVYRKNHFIIWAWVLVYEYICLTDGVGAIFHNALEYNDLSLILLLSLLLIVLFYFMEFVLIKVEKKFFFWKQ